MFIEIETYKSSDPVGVECKISVYWYQMKSEVGFFFEIQECFYNEYWEWRKTQTLDKLFSNIIS